MLEFKKGSEQLEKVKEGHAHLTYPDLNKAALDQSELGLEQPYEEAPIQEHVLGAVKEGVTLSTVKTEGKTWRVP